MMSINDNEVVDRFNLYLYEEMNVQQAFEQVLHDAIEEQLSKSELEEVVYGCLIPRILCHFAEYYSRMDNCYDNNSDPNNVFHTYVAFNDISQNLATDLAEAINVGAAHEDEEDEDGNNFVFKSE
jgi:hypothetical protein